MRRISIVLIVVLVALVILVGYVYLAKPVVVLPTVTMNMPENSSLGALQRQLNINQLSFRARTDGKIMIIGDGKELGYVSYNLGSLSNAVQLGEKIGLSPTQQRAISTVLL